jgi:pimeloyl-ACP methyl ester carboxylesterase
MSEPLHYLDVGQGPPLVLVHGDFLDGPTTWAAQVETLPAHHRLIVLDRRGRGRSPREPRPYTIAGDAVDVLATADLAGLTGFHLGGQSYGAIVALEVARRAPARVESLHLIEPPYLALLDDPVERERMMAAVEIFARARERGPERTVTDFVTMLAGPEAAARLRTRPVWEVMLRESDALADVEAPSSYPASAVDDVRLTVPVRVYRGGRSSRGLRRIAEVLASRLPGALLVDVPDAPHDVQRVAGPFNAALLAATGAG